MRNNGLVLPQESCTYQWVSVSSDLVANAGARTGRRHCKRTLPDIVQSLDTETARYPGNSIQGVPGEASARVLRRPAHRPRSFLPRSDVGGHQKGNPSRHPCFLHLSEVGASCGLHECEGKRNARLTTVPFFGHFRWLAPLPKSTGEHMHRVKRCPSERRGLLHFRPSHAGTSKRCRICIEDTGG